MSAASSNSSISKHRKTDTDGTSAAASGRSPSRILSYKMDHDLRGDALIICNMEFRNRSPLHGYEKDAAELKDVLHRLGFSVHVENNKSKAKIISLAEDFAKNDYTNSDCFVMVVLSHGGDGTVSGSDDKEADIDEIVDNFKPQHCKSLASKPKIFIFQACRGGKHDNGAAIAANASNFIPQDTTECGEGTTLTIPSAANFLFCYATMPGFVSWVRQNGSCYIQELIKVVKELVLSTGCEPLEFLQLLTVVSRNVSEDEVLVNRNEESKKQMPCFLSTLTRNLILSPKTKKPSSAAAEKPESEGGNRKVAAKGEKQHKGAGGHSYENITNHGIASSFGSTFGGDQTINIDNSGSNTTNITGTKGTVNKNKGDVTMNIKRRRRSSSSEQE